MKRFFVFFSACFTVVAGAQETGSIAGKLTDKEYNNEPLAFANILIKGTTKGTTSDFDGLYEIANLDPGTYTVVYSYLGYETVEIPNINVEVGKVSTINVPLSASQGVSLDEVVVTTVARKDSEVALLLDQKKAVTLETSIGAQELARKGASDAATAVSKVTGISKDEGSGNVYVRGLGDRFNITTLNGLPLPSNNTSKKNIDLGIFGTSIIQSIGIDKTFNAANYGDFGGANININSRDYNGSGFFELSAQTGANTEAVGVDQFYLNDGPDFSGFYNSDIPNNPFSDTFSTSWDRETSSTPINSSFSLKGGDAFNLGGNTRLNFFAVGSFSNNNGYREGVNRGAPNVGNGLPNSDFDYERYSYNTSTTLMTNVGLRLGTGTALKYNFLLLNNSQQKQEEFSGIIDREDDAPEGGGFIQRATFDRTTLYIHQLLGKHDIGDNFEVNWGGAYNYVKNVVPDRRQNTLLPVRNNRPDGPKSFALVSAASENHRFFQELDEEEIAANLSATYKFKKNEEDFDGKLTLGYNGRFKNVDFDATQFNFQFLDINNQPEVDPRNIDAYFEENPLSSGLYQIRTFRGPASFGGALEPQTYGGEQQINAAYLTFEYKFSPKFTVFAGARGEQITQSINWNTVIQGEDSNELDIFEFLPSLSFKYALNDKQNLRFAASRTYTLPQFKERAPFLFQEEINQDSFGNPELKNSINYNFDLRWELFPTSSEIISLGVFGKLIENPINTFLVVSAANDLSYANTGDNATAFGAELEVRLNVLNKEKETENSVLKESLSIGGNISYLNTNQELDSQKVSEETNLSAAFTNTEAPLQGASDIILNGDVSYFTEFSENKNLRSTLAINYFSERLFALGSTGRGHLVDKGYATLDLISKAQLGKHLGIGLNLRNLLNPLIERVNENAEGKLDTENPAVPGFLEDGPVTVLSYKKGINLSLSLTYRF
ncbi:TonB-dependent receptor domain-containing protein [Maribacter sp. 2304DJ31-5]|uniref:TonB-dependent receptor n=1 Tax=Maribacter sp. 2304DJ31-5 TaxID=3386273 RepID=UPI0039BD1443